MVSQAFSSPEPVEMIPADRIRPIISATVRELEFLERLAAQAVAAADDAEAWEQAATDAGASWTLVRRHREEREEARRDAQVMVELATRHAQYVLSEARAEADDIRAGGGRIASLLGDYRARSDDRPVVELVAEAPAPPAVARPRPTVVEPPTIVEQPAAPTSPPAVAVIEPSPVVVAPPAPVEATPVDEPTIVDVSTVVPEPVVATVESFERADQAAPVTPNAGFWPAERPARRRLALPLSATLEAVAVLLILVFILLRLS